MARKIAGALLAAIFLLSLFRTIGNIIDRPAPDLIAKAPAKTHQPARLQKTDRTDLDTSETAHLCFSVALSLLKFDIKQNLSAWPVLATGIVRSPPFYLI